MKITYRQENGCFYPNIKLPEQTNYNIGKYGLLHLDYIKEHRKGRYTTLLTECRLNEYLHTIDLEANEMLEIIIPRLAAEREIDENTLMMPLIYNYNNQIISDCIDIPAKLNLKNGSWLPLTKREKNFFRYSCYSNNRMEYQFVSCWQTMEHPISASSSGSKPLYRLWCIPLG